MNRNKPRASIIIPVKNAERYILAAVKSVLVENDVPLEIVVVDDASSDDSVNQVMRLNDERVRLLKNSGRGAVAAMNAGFRAAVGDILMCCDADDLYPTKRIRQQIEWLDQNTDFDAVCGIFSTIDPAGTFIAEMPCGTSAAELTAELQNGKVRTHLCTYAIRAAFFKRVGEFRDFFESAYDTDFQLRSGETGRIAYIPANWYFYRIHSSSITHTQPNVLRDFFAKTAFELQRQRRQLGFDDLQMGRKLPKPNPEGSSPMSSNKHMQGFLLGRAWEERRQGKRLLALRTALRSLAFDPTQAHVWRSIIALIIKPSA